MTRPSAPLCALAAAIALISPAAVAQQLAVGEVIPLEPPPGYEFRAVYTPPVLHSRWEPADNSFGQTFREPLYTAPPGYIYRYVRGYTAVRVVDPDWRPLRKVAVRRHAGKSSVTPSCVTELGYGHYSNCR